VTPIWAGIVSPPDLGGNSVDRCKESRPDRRAIAIAGHAGDVETARRGLEHPDATVRATALTALERLGELDDAGILAAFADPDPVVRRRVAGIAARHPRVDLGPLLADADPSVVEVAAWACGEHEHVADEILAALVGLATGAGAGEEPLVRESAVAALGAIGDDRGLDAILTATTDRPAVRRRAVLALAPFVAPAHPRAAEVRAALERALTDRDWQVRQAAEDLTT
jgi:HEAT repeat protein